MTFSVLSPCLASQQSLISNIRKYRWSPEEKKLLENLVVGGYHDGARVRRLHDGDAPASAMMHRLDYERAVDDAVSRIANRDQRRVAFEIAHFAYSEGLRVPDDNPSVCFANVLRSIR